MWTSSWKLTARGQATASCGSSARLPGFCSRGEPPAATRPRRPSPTIACAGGRTSAASSWKPPAGRSGESFTVEDRAFEVDHSSPNAPQQMLPDFPMRGWVAAQGADGAGLAVLARGLYEAAVRRVEGGVDVAVTLLRGVGHLSRP